MPGYTASIHQAATHSELHELKLMLHLDRTNFINN
jgi:hypothetical protein